MKAPKKFYYLNLIIKRTIAAANLNLAIKSI